MVRHDTVLQRVHSHHVAGGTAQHVPGSRADLQDFTGILVHSHNGRLPDHQALAVGIDQHIGGTQVHAQVIGKHIE